MELRFSRRNAGALVRRSPPQVRGALEVIKSLFRLRSSNSAIKRHATSHRPSLSHALMLAPKVIRSSPNQKHVFAAKEECPSYIIGPDGTEGLVALKLHESSQHVITGKRFPWISMLPILFFLNCGLLY